MFHVKKNDCLLIHLISNADVTISLNVLLIVPFCLPSQLIFTATHSLYFHCQIHDIYASPSSGEAYRDRRLTTNFELWVEIFLCADMFPCEDSKTVSVCLYVCPYPEKRNYPGFVNISRTFAIDTSMERSSRVLQHAHGKCEFF